MLATSPAPVEDGGLRKYISENKVINKMLPIFILCYLQFN